MAGQGSYITKFKNGDVYDWMSADPVMMRKITPNFGTWTKKVWDGGEFAATFPKIEVAAAVLKAQFHNGMLETAYNGTLKSKVTKSKRFSYFKSAWQTKWKETLEIVEGKLNKKRKFEEEEEEEDEVEEASNEVEGVLLMGPHELENARKNRMLKIEVVMTNINEDMSEMAAKFNSKLKAIEEAAKEQKKILYDATRARIQRNSETFKMRKQEWMKLGELLEIEPDESDYTLIPVDPGMVQKIGLVELKSDSSEDEDSEEEEGSEEGSKEGSDKAEGSEKGGQWEQE
jgi:hypothetical protein